MMSFGIGTNLLILIGSVGLWTVSIELRTWASNLILVSIKFHELIVYLYIR